MILRKYQLGGSVLPESSNLNLNQTNNKTSLLYGRNLTGNMHDRNLDIFAVGGLDHQNGYLDGNAGLQISTPNKSLFDLGVQGNFRGGKDFFGIDHRINAGIQGKMGSRRSPVYGSAGGYAGIEQNRSDGMGANRGVYGNLSYKSKQNPRLTAFLEGKLGMRSSGEGFNNTWKPANSITGGVSYNL